jgi:uncharacterized protein YciI
MNDPLGPLLVLTYDYPPDVLERRAPHREGHLAHARAWKADGRLVMGGALGDPPHSGVLVFRAGREEVEAFASQDPYVQQSVATGYRIEPWNVVI